MDKTKIIGKYAIILVIFYAIQFGFNYWFQIISKIVEYDSTDVLIRQYSFIGLSIILNIITALIVSRDIKKYEINIRFLVLSTIIFRPLGVCLFLIGLMKMNTEEQIKPAPNN
jgi:hypothetical protein